MENILINITKEVLTNLFIMLVTVQVEITMLDKLKVEIVNLLDGGTKQIFILNILSEMKNIFQKYIMILFRSIHNILIHFCYLNLKIQQRKRSLIRLSHFFNKPNLDVYLNIKNLLFFLK